MATAKSTAKKAPAKKPATARPVRSLKSDEARWQAQDDLRTLQRAQEIQSSKTRLAMAQKEAQAQMNVLAKVAK